MEHQEHEERVDDPPKNTGSPFSGVNRPTVCRWTTGGRLRRRAKFVNTWVAPPNDRCLNGCISTASSRRDRSTLGRHCHGAMICMGLEMRKRYGWYDEEGKPCPALFTGTEESNAPEMSDRHII